MNYARSMTSNEQKIYNEKCVNYQGCYFYISEYGLVKTRDNNYVHIHHLETKLIITDDELTNFHVMMYCKFKKDYVLFWNIQNTLSFPKSRMHPNQNHVDISTGVADAISLDRDSGMKVRFIGSTVFDFKDMVHIYECDLKNLNKFESAYVIIEKDRMWDNYDKINNMSLNVFDYICTK